MRLRFAAVFRLGHGARFKSGAHCCCIRCRLISPAPFWRVGPTGIDIEPAQGSVKSTRHHFYPAALATRGASHTPRAVAIPRR